LSNILGFDSIENMELLTIAQASELTGKSEHAIRRLIKHLIGTDKKAEEKIKHEPIANGSFRYSIEKNYLLLHVPSPNTQDNEYLTQSNVQNNMQPSMQSDTQPNIRPNGQKSSQNLQPNTQGYNLLLTAKDETIEVLKNQIKQRDEQLKQKDEQIRKKDEQINQFLERDRETNILLKGYQDRYLLEAPIQTPNTPPAGNQQSKSEQKKPHKPTKQPAKQNQQQKKKGFFSWLR
jgi:hypothetical protein